MLGEFEMLISPRHAPDGIAASERRSRPGFDPLEVLNVVRTAYGGEIVGQIYEGNRVYDVSVVLASDSQPRVSGIGALPLRSPDGNYVALKQLADIYESSARYVILHQGARRVQTITCNVQGRAVDSFVDEKPGSASLSVASRRHVCRVLWHCRGTEAIPSRSRGQLAAGRAGDCAALIHRHAQLPQLVVGLNLSFALVGGVLAGLFSGGNLSLGSLVGFVTLFGITRHSLC